MLSYRFLSHDDLIAQCRVEHYRGSGPGGQKRNKTSNAVRLKHLETGLIVTATEARSAKENQLNAVRRMLLKLATEVREEIDLVRFEPPDWFLSVRHDGKIDASHRHAFYPAVGGLILDLLDALGGNPSDVATNLGVKTTTIIRVLENEPVFWAKATQIRTTHGLPGLTHRR